MKKYVICVDNGADYNAASKARQDAEEIILSLGYEPLQFPGERTAAGNPLKQIRLFCQTMAAWKKLDRIVEPGSLVVIQYPFFPIKMVYLLRWLLPHTRMKKNIHFLALIHDLNSLRGLYGKAAVYSDQHFLKMFDQIISHNQKMTDYLMKTGIPEEKISELILFDYLTETTPKIHMLRDGITVAGNLDPEKSGYISRLIKMTSENYSLHLYGKGLNGKNDIRNIIFHGAYAPEILPGELEGAFGLVWDGSSAESCDGATGNYLRYNNPHKLSLYLTAGLPVIIWKDAAEAEFVKKNQIGIAVDSLNGLEERIGRISETEYALMRENTKRVGERIQKGDYLITVLREVEMIIWKGSKRCEAGIRQA